MRTVGIIAEYNPFHSGHEYHLQEAKKQAAADYAVIVMSPDFVQRGTPAVFDKYTRAEMALRAGADLVLELPVCYACGSAEFFAEGAVALLDQLGVLDTLCFGSEQPDTSLFLQAADFLLNEPASYRLHLQALLKSGMTFPQARAKALLAENPSLAALLGMPNNVLGVEYCKALQKFSSAIRPLPICRKGNGYDSTTLDGEFCSATALRQALLVPAPKAPASNADSLLSYIPENCRPLFEKAAQTPVFPDDLLPFLIPKLLERDAFSEVLDISSDLSDRIAKTRFSCIGHSYGEIVELLKTRQLTQVRIQRALLHLILGLLSEDLRAFRADQTIYYAKVLGFRSSASPLLHRIKKSSQIPLIVKSAKAASCLKEYCGSKTSSLENANRMYHQDLFASHLYRSILSCNYQIPFRSDYQISPVILSE